MGRGGTDGGLASRCIALAMATLALSCPACKEEPSHFDRIVASAKSVEPPAPPPTKDFVFPAMSGLPAKEVIPTVNRASKESPPGQEGKIDEWLRGFQLPVVLVGPTRKFASDIGTLTCHFRDKALQCGIPAKIPEKHKFFVTSSLTCIGAGGERELGHRHTRIGHRQAIFVLDLTAQQRPVGFVVHGLARRGRL